MSCPHADIKEYKKLNEENKCKFAQQTQQINQEEQNKDSDSSIEYEQENDNKKPQSSCPFKGSIDCQNPGYQLLEEKSELKYISCYQFMFDTTQDQKFYDYPYVLKNTLFHDDENIKQIRQREFSFRAYYMEKFLQKGNKSLKKQNIKQAQFFYERAFSCISWLEFKLKFNENSSIQDIYKIFNIDIDDFEKINIEKQNQQLFLESIQRICTQLTEDNLIHKGTEELDAEQKKMQKQFMYTIYMNLSVSYMLQGFFSEAIKVQKLALEINKQISLLYFRMSQAIAYNLSSSHEDLKQSYQYLVQAFQVKQKEKIFDSSINILKILNIHNAVDNMILYGDYLKNRVDQQEQFEKQQIQKLIDRFTQIKKNEQAIIEEGKIPDDSYMNLTLFKKCRYFEVIQEIINTYDRAILFFNEQVFQIQIERTKKRKIKLHFRGIKYLNQLKLDQDSHKMFEQFKINLNNPKNLIILNYVKIEQLKQIFENYKFDPQIFMYSMDLWQEKNKENLKEDQNLLEQYLQQNQAFNQPTEKQDSIFILQAIFQFIIIMIISMALVFLFNSKLPI